MCVLSLIRSTLHSLLSEKSKPPQTDTTQNQAMHHAESSALHRQSKCCITSYSWNRFAFNPWISWNLILVKTLELVVKLRLTSQTLQTISRAPCTAEVRQSLFILTTLSCKSFTNFPRPRVRILPCFCHCSFCSSRKGPYTSNPDGSKRMKLRGTRWKVKQAEHGAKRCVKSPHHLAPHPQKRLQQTKTQSK